MPGYENPNLEEAEQLNTKAEELFTEGTEAGEMARKYVRQNGVVSSLVLFLIAAGQHFTQWPVRITANALAVCLLIYTLGYLTMLPRSEREEVRLWTASAPTSPRYATAASSPEPAPASSAQPSGQSSPFPATSGAQATGAKRVSNMTDEQKGAAAERMAQYPDLDVVRRSSSPARQARPASSSPPGCCPHLHALVSRVTHRKGHRSSERPSCACECGQAVLAGDWCGLPRHQPGAGCQLVVNPVELATFKGCSGLQQTVARATAGKAGVYHPPEGFDTGLAEIVLEDCSFRDRGQLGCRHDEHVRLLRVLETH